MEEQLASGKPVEGMYLTYLLSSEKMSRAELYICITELLLGGVDTVRRSKKTLYSFNNTWSRHYFRFVFILLNFHRVNLKK